MGKFLVFLVACCLWAPAAMAASGYEELVVRRVAGEAKVGTFGGTEFTPLKGGERLNRIDYIQVEKGDAELALCKKTRLRLSAGTKMTVIDLGIEVTGLYLGGGEARVEYAPELPRMLVFETAAGLAEPKGAAVFTVNVAADGTMEVTVRKGVVIAEGDDCRLEVKSGHVGRIGPDICVSKVSGKSADSEKSP